jgi:hypothetical protein
MSVQALSWVLENSAARLGARLVLIALANHAHDDGSNAYMSQATIAREARLTVRQVRRCLNELETSGEIIRSGKTEHGVVKWQLRMGVPKSPAGQIVPGHSRLPARTNRAAGVSDMSDKPLREPSGTVRGAQARTTDFSEYDKAVIG